MKSIIRIGWIFIFLLLAVRIGAEPKNHPLAPVEEKRSSGYVAKQEGIQQVLNALSTENKKPFILSAKAAKKTVTGDFDFSNPKKTFDKLVTQLNLIWYDDGTSFYVYDASEMKSSVVLLKAASVANLNEFFIRTDLFDKRYPIRGDGKIGGFYISGPPIYVDLVVNAAAYLDGLYRNVDLTKQKVEIVKLHNTFVNDRSYESRGSKINISGISSIIEMVLGATGKRRPAEQITLSKGHMESPQNSGIGQADPATSMSSSTFNADGGQVRVVAYAETNSLLIKGTHEQVEFVKAIIQQLDVPKKHIELSLWIIDVSKENLDQLGVNWFGSLDLGSTAHVVVNADALQFNSNNGTILDGKKFVAMISALSQKGQAQIVSRPVLLTQENVSAIFDHNNTFYTKLEAERSASLDSVTYGTLINVLPRFLNSVNEIEMVLDIEDGRQASGSDGASSVNGMPVVTRTKISTVARVPKDKSLLVGGYTLDQYRRLDSKVPLLGDLPYVGGWFRSTSEDLKKVVRVFLIQPRVLENENTWSPEVFRQAPETVHLNDVIEVLKQQVGIKNGRNWDK